MGGKRSRLGRESRSSPTELRRCLTPTSPCPSPNSFISLRRRALAPIAWLRAYARGAVAPSGPDGPVGRRENVDGDGNSFLSKPGGGEGTWAAPQSSFPPASVGGGGRGRFRLLSLSSPAGRRGPVISCL